MKGIDALIDDLDQAAVQAGLAHGRRGVGDATRRARNQEECDAAFALQDRIGLIRDRAVELGDERLIELLRET